MSLSVASDSPSSRTKAELWNEVKMLSMSSSRFQSSTTNFMSSFYPDANNIILDNPSLAADNNTIDSLGAIQIRAFRPAAGAG